MSLRSSLALTLLPPPTMQPRARRQIERSSEKRSSPQGRSCHRRLRAALAAWVPAASLPTGKNLWPVRCCVMIRSVRVFRPILSSSYTLARVACGTRMRW